MIQTIKSDIKRVTVTSDFNEDMKKWLENEAKIHGFRWLLAHALDGIIWGEEREDGLYLSNILFGPKLRIDTLQMARLFGETGELLIWKGDNGWQARILKDGKGRDKEYYDESQLLWGTKVEDRKNGFVLLHHGSEGLRHAPPFVSEDDELRLKLNIRHYINYDSDGQAYVDFSRLISIEAFNEKEVI
jgi:CRISPR-associated protein (TIGR03984 family)